MTVINSRRLIDDVFFSFYLIAENMPINFKIFTTV